MRRAPLVLALALWAGVAQADPPPPIASARVLPARHHELALFQHSRFGLGQGMQLESRLLLFGLLPNLALKWQAYESGSLSGALRWQLTYPGILMRTLAREGAGGLLPPGSEPAETVMIDLGYLETYSTDRWVLTLDTGVEVAPRRSGAGNQPILDFPWLYPRFGALHASAVIRAAGRFALRLPHGFGASLDVTTYGLVGKATGWVVELGGVLRYQPSDHLILELGFRTARSKLPVGKRWHWLPTLGVRVPFAGRRATSSQE